jgi:uncharacterized repeat protein (TIGR03803 family)
MTFKRSLLVRGSLFAILVAMLFAGATFAAGTTEYVVYNFPHTALPIVAGCNPAGNLLADSEGNLYGAAGCGTFSQGVIFKLTRPVAPATAWTESVLYSFTGGSDGATPNGGLIFDAAGNLYGTTDAGGTSGYGTVFELSPPAAGVTYWTETVLHSFEGGTADGRNPLAGVTFDKSGNLYGVTFQGGTVDKSLCRIGCGIVFQLTPPVSEGAAWTENVLHFFTGTQGVGPRGAVVLDPKGNIYGAAQGGGKTGDGLIYRLTPPTAGLTAWAFRVLYAFEGIPDGLGPFAALTFHGKGLLYGTTNAGGAEGFGTVFQLAPPAVAGGAWTETVLYSFAGGTDGAYPQADVVFDSAGNIYGTTSVGGAQGDEECTAQTEGCGVVFEMSPPAAGGDSWHEEILHAFPSSSKDGYLLTGGVIFGKASVLFGPTASSKAGTAGAVYGVIK